MKGILLHGGHGTRLRPLTHTGPKQLLPIANKPMSEYCIESMKDAGINDIAIIVGGIGSNKVREYYGDGKKFGVNITYVEQDYPKGIAHAIKLCEEFINNEKFLVFLGDNLIQKSIQSIAEDFKNSNADATILLCEVDNPSRFGIALVENNRIIKIEEKPRKPKSNLAVTGIYFLTPIIFEIISNQKPSWRNELEITDALQLLIEKGKRITYNIITDYWKDTGTPEDIINANHSVLKNLEPYFLGSKEENVIIDGKISVGSGTIIRRGCILKGPIIIGKNCVIDEFTELGPNTSIGDNSLLSRCIIRDSIIMSNCSLNTQIIIKNSIIASNSSITEENYENKEKRFLLGEGTQIFL